jgi:osmotically-inducible protein OsmY
VREAIRADSSTSQYAGTITIAVRDGVVTLRGVVDDLVDSDNLLAVAEYVDDVDEVVDELRVRGLE